MTQAHCLSTWLVALTYSLSSLLNSELITFITSVGVKNVYENIIISYAQRGHNILKSKRIRVNGKRFECARPAAAFYEVIKELLRAGR